ncbi:glycosyltransferase family 9 protein [Flavihumibacter fluvii]|uniref:glycosyltransferase family 9 protein n=1 Tax=Flavihumibacter fluvii TaxID=2838157 RepID=UPI001BDF0778|nr:glycosyltransferase family 9 protein [Flavihumibacter fluvii]ULQ53078.1 glycosyltransferase family 9 protein [Flavihumibacter fluvii]
MKILIIRFSSIGDIVLTTPVIRCLKQQVENIEIHYLTKKNYEPVLAANPYIHQLHFLDADIQETIDRMLEEEFDLVIDLHHNLRSLRIKNALKCKSRSFPKLNLQKWLYTNLKINLLPGIHIVDRYMKTVHDLGVINDGKGLDYFIPADAHIQQADIPAAHQLGYIGLVIGAAHATKRMPLSKLKELVVSIDHPIILLGGKEDKAQGEILAAADPIKIYNACGKFNLNESADLVKQAKLIISHDTGLMHIAAAFRKPIISVWGNTVPAFGMYPYYGEKNLSTTQQPFEIVEVQGLRCRPCSKIGYDACPKGHFKCMENIPVQHIRQLAQKLLTGR